MSLKDPWDTQIQKHENIHKLLPKTTERCHIQTLPQGRETGKLSSHKHRDHTFDHPEMGLEVFNSYNFRPLRAKQATLELQFP